MTTLGSGVDGAVLRLERAYEVRGLLNRLTSFDSPTVGSGTVVNDVQWTYNSFSQPIKTYQAHAGAVNPSTTLNVQIQYANGSANTVRPTGLIYPNGRTVVYDYGAWAGIDDAVSRIASLIDSDIASTHLADYSYLGMRANVQQDSTQATLQYTLISLTGGDDPVTGDIYTGLDLFGRVKDCRWRNTSSGVDLSRVQYGYNRASSRIWRANPTAPADNYDWLYGYDGLQRLTGGTRGTLNGTRTGITSPQFGQCWTLDSTGNWQGFRQDDTGAGTWSLQQSRTANRVNEITGITNSVGSAWEVPAYDPNGNMTTIPQPADPSTEFAATYDAWNRLVKLVDPTTSHTVQVNQYDGRNYRTVIQSYTAGTLSETRNSYYTDAWQNLEERLGTSPESATPNRQFVWGMQYLDSLVCRDRSVSGTLDERFYGCQDSNWNMTTIVDTSGVVQERYEYDPYGDTTFLSPSFVIRLGSDYGWETTYAGYTRDTITGLFSVRNRFYHAALGAWITRDPLAMSTAMTQLYQYCASQPLTQVDLLGLSESPPGGNDIDFNYGDDDGKGGVFGFGIDGSYSDAWEFTYTFWIKLQNLWKSENPPLVPFPPRDCPNVLPLGDYPPIPRPPLKLKPPGTPPRQHNRPPSGPTPVPPYDELYDFFPNDPAGYPPFLTIG